MEISGKVIKVLPLQSGEGKNGLWQKQEFVIEVPGQFPKKVCFSLWGDKVTQFPIKEGDPVTLNFDLESREFNNRWYTEARVWRVSAPATTTQDHPAVKPASPGNGDAFSSLTDNDIPGSDTYLSKDISDDDMPF